jgi:hypothetical protein
MTDVFMESTFEQPLAEGEFEAMLESNSGCFGLYRVEWQQSCLSSDRRRMFCWFTAPDLESMRQALRKSKSESPCWAGTIHDAPSTNAPPLEHANVLVERSWPDPVTLDEIQAKEDRGAWCLETHGVKFVRTYFSLDRRRMMCLYSAADAESVRIAQRQAGMPVDAIWSFDLKQP